MTANTQSKLGTSLLKSLMGLRQQKGEILIEDVGAILEGMASSLQTSDSAPDVFLKKEIEKMANYIVQAKSEIFAMVPTKDGAPTKNISAASQELGEVVKATAAATNKIMDAADQLGALAGDIKDAKLSAKLAEISASMYEACTFQDITGQRITKVTRLLETLEARIMNLVELFGGHLPEGYTPPKEIETNRRIRPDEHLCNGPQGTGEAPSQADIDALFKSIGNGG